MFFSHVLSPTGLVLPAAAICAAARRRGVATVVDGAHAPAMVPLQLDNLNCDFYGANCHKWLLAPTGSGFLVFGRGNEDRLQPLQVSWGWRRERGDLDAQDEYGSTPRLRFFEFEGTRDYCPWLAIPEAIAFQEGLGVAAIREHNRGLAQYARGVLGGRLGLAEATPRHPDLHGFLTAFRLPWPLAAPKLRQALWEKFRVEVPVVERPDGLLIRVSTHFYNNEAEIDRLGEALATLL